MAEQTPTPMPTERMRGTVAWFNATSGYGFIAPNDEPRDVFVHASAFRAGDHRGVLVKGDVVEFVISRDEQGRQRAEHVVRIEHSPETPR